jgi:uncharacterized membrane protein YfcA
MLLDFTAEQSLIVAVLFIWTGFVRTGLGFGGAALGLPLMLFIHNDPRLWLPIISVHLLFFSGLTLRTRLNNVDWAYLKRSSMYIIPPAIVGVFGLLNLPILWLNVFIYSITLIYGFIWLFNRTITSARSWMDKVLLVIGGYVAGTSLTGAPLMVAVYMRNVDKEQLRDTLFVLWFILVSIKMATFIAFNADLHFLTALSLLPVAAIGHVLGLKAHDTIIRNDLIFKRWIGGGLVVISALGLWNLRQGIGDLIHSNLFANKLLEFIRNAAMITS